MKKTILCVLIIMFLSFSAFSLSKPYFTGIAGFMETIGNNLEETKYDPSITSEVFFSGLFDFNGVFYLKSSFYVYGRDIFNSTLFSDPESSENAFFRMEELSGTLRINGANATHYISFFHGEYEPIGSDSFIQHHFGNRSYASPFTKSWQSFFGLNVYPFYATGLSYTLHPQSSIIFNLAGYKNDAMENDTSVNVLNLDLRTAGSYDFIAFDAALGMGLPLENKNDQDEEVILMIRKMLIHTGVNIILGRPYSNNLYIQAGLSRLTINSDEDESFFDADNLFVFLEERPEVEKIRVYLSEFMLPEESARKMLYLRSILDANKDCTSLIGLNLTIESKDLTLGSSELAIGMHGTFAYATENYKGSISDWNPEFCLTPYGTIPVSGGEVHTALSLTFTEMSEYWMNGIQFFIGFKTQF